MKTRTIGFGVLGVAALIFGAVLIFNSNEAQAADTENTEVTTDMNENTEVEEAEVEKKNCNPENCERECTPEECEGMSEKECEQMCEKKC